MWRKDNAAWKAGMMTDSPQLILNLPPHHNHGLFADHYLDRVLPGRAEWGRLPPEAAPVLADVTRIFKAFVPTNDEQQTERDLVRPILDALGHSYEVQGRLRVPGRIHKPDYIFYQDLASRNANRNAVLDKSLPTQGGLAVGDAKYWGRSLDSALLGSGDDNRNPAFQIYWYVLHSGVQWGFLSNGKRWRLVHRESADRLDVYYEVDLQELAQAGDISRFLYFYAFFRRAAFDPGQLGLAELLRASTDYAHGVGASLKNQVYDALRHVAQGFLDYPPNGLHADAETRKAIYDNALILLYRLIFILYAEARDLLPIRENAQYRNTYSLQAIKHAIATDISAGHLLLPSSGRIWTQLHELFSFIDRGEPPLKIATFNGGLFDPRKHPFLEQYVVGDYHLQQAIDKLARLDGDFIDYRDLAVRHMGSIYEGLLEYKVVPTNSEDTNDSHSLEQCGSTALAIFDSPPWSIDLITDKGERKASGSYYTPDYIVKFIVEHTVGPALREAIADTTDDAAKVQAVLAVNVLDPAMGSGHFLVEATEYIARFLVDLGIMPLGKSTEEADLAYWKRRVVQSCIYGVDLNPLAVELAKLSLWLITVAKDRPLSFLDHHCRPGNSLVGARLHDLQQRSIASARAMRGSTAARRQVPPVEEDQRALFNAPEFTARIIAAVNDMWRIEQIEADSVEQVKAQEGHYANLRRELTAKYGKLADLLTVQHFHPEIPADQWEKMIDYVMGRVLAMPPALQASLARVEADIARERFFHWELEFPELFFDRFGRALGEQGGFAAVIGNPPYVRQEQLASYKPYFKQQYQSFHGVADLYLYFYERGLDVAKQHGRMAYISSGTFARANFAAPFRQWLPGVAQLESLIDFGENQPFPGAEMVRPSIVVLQKQAMTEDFRSLFVAEKIPESLEMALNEQGVDCSPSALAQSEWTFQAAASTRLFQKIMAAGRPLHDVVEGRLYRGILTGLNEAFIIDQATRDRLIADDPACSAILKKIFRGEDLRPWYQEDEGRWLIAIPCGWTRQTFGTGLSEEEAWICFAERYKSIAAYLLPFADAARMRCDKGNYWWELRPCDYYDAFQGTKIYWPDIAKLPRFSWDENGKIINNKGYIIPNPAPSLLGLLQSRVLWFAVSQLCQPLRLRAGLWQYQMFTQYTSRLPIPDMIEADNEALGALALQITNLARTRYALHQRVCHRLLTDFSPAQLPIDREHAPEQKLNQKLTAWWEQDFSALRAELLKVFKRDIAVRERDEWEAWFAAQRAEHARLTAEIVNREIALNACVYALFGLTGEEIEVIEASTKYRYGEV